MKTLIIIFFLVLWLSVALKGDVIYVSGNVSGNWSTDTVIVTGEVRVPPGEMLQIEPGVSVLFQTYCKFIVDSSATLLAIGTAVDSIIFDDFASNPNWHGIRFLDASDSSRLEYCHLTHGYASGSGNDNNGGGIYCFNSNIIIKNCTIDTCVAYYKGGGIYCNHSSPLISDNIIRDNSTSSSYYSYGGGIYCEYYSFPYISGNTFNGNTSYGQYGKGGAIACDHYSYPTIINNSISENFSDYGGAICILDYSHPNIFNNNISENASNYPGGGIYCLYSNPNIRGNTISGNSSSTSTGGGIYCAFETPNISGNIISGNSACTGGGMDCYNSAPSIIGNIFYQNSSYSYYSYGGGISSFYYSSPTISGNIFSGNTASAFGYGYGGAILCSGSSANFSGNVFYGNSADHAGGAIWIDTATIDTFEFNEISHNITNGNGGGLYLHNVNMLMNKNTIVDNQASSGGGLHSVGANPTLVNSIFWGNVPEQISPVSNVQATYCDINFDPVWPGMGNINVYPDFVDTALGDYRLLWGSPCIDTGDPDPIYLDPDSTIADMGAFYYEQVSPLRILLSPHQTLYLIPASGDTMDYTIRITNRDAVSHRAIIWCDVTLPDGSIYGPILGPVTITIGAGITLERVRTQYVPAAAPMGVYYYNAYAVLGADTSKDSFIWGKLGSVGQDNDVGFWTNTGEDLIDLEPSSLFYPLSIILYPCYPNPFNSITNISFYLSESGQIKCVIYDLMGRMIDILMDGELKPGRYNITLEGSKLPSGIYFCRLQCGDKFLTQKIVMMK